MPRREKSTTQKTDGWNTKMNRVYIISIRVLRSRCGRDTKHSDSVVPNCDSCWRLVQFSNSPHIFCVFSLVFLFHFFFFFVVNSSLIDASVDEYLSPLLSPTESCCMERWLPSFTPHHLPIKHCFSFFLASGCHNSLDFWSIYNWKSQPFEQKRRKQMKIVAQTSCQLGRNVSHNVALSPFVARPPPPQSALFSISVSPPRLKWILSFIRHFLHA